MFFCKSRVNTVGGDIGLTEAVLDYGNICKVIPVEEIMHQGRPYHLSLGYLFGLGLFSNTLEDVVVDFER